MPDRPFIPGARLGLLTPAYDAFCQALGLGERFRAFEVRLLDGLSPRRVLEVGCGSGELLRRLAERFPHADVVGLDVDPRMLAQAREKLDRAGLAATLVEQRAEATAFPDAGFDLVVSSLMLHHLPREQKRAALREWGRVLDPAGVLLLVDLGPPRTLLARALTWPLRFEVLEHQADNFRGRIPGMLQEAGFTFREVGVFGGVVFAWRAVPGRGASRR